MMNKTIRFIHSHICIWKFREILFTQQMCMHVKNCKMLAQQRLSNEIWEHKNDMLGYVVAMCGGSFESCAKKRF